MLSQRIKDKLKHASTSDLRRDFPEIESVVETIGKFSDDEREVFAHLICGDHRTIQQKITGTFLRFFYVMADKPHDARNEASVKAAMEIVVRLGTYGWQLPYI